MTRSVRRLPTSAYPAAGSTDLRVTGIDRSVARLTAMPPLRAADRPHGPSLSAVWAVFEDEDAWSCTYCDSPLGGKVVGEVDHVIPLAAGGLHAMFNLTPSCRTCNRGKSDRPAQVWLTELAGQIVTERPPVVTG
jgi:HNH endonuclease